MRDGRDQADAAQFVSLSSVTTTRDKKKYALGHKIRSGCPSRHEDLRNEREAPESRPGIAIHEQDREQTRQQVATDQHNLGRQPENDRCKRDAHNRRHDTNREAIGPRLSAAHKNDKKSNNSQMQPDVERVPAVHALEVIRQQHQRTREEDEIRKPDRDQHRKVGDEPHRGRDQRVILLQPRLPPEEHRHERDGDDQRCQDFSLAPPNSRGLRHGEDQQDDGRCWVQTSAQVVVATKTSTTHR